MTPLETIMTLCQAEVGWPSPIVCPRAGRKALCRVFAALGYTRGAEIGVWTGGFSEQMCQLVPGLRLLCVDPWTAYADYHEKKNDQARLDDAYAMAGARLAPFPCTIRRMTSLAAAADVPDRSLDFCYLDANHALAFVLDDIAAWMPKIRPGGMLAGHDYLRSATKQFIEVPQAVDHYTREHAIAPWFVLSSEKSPSWCWVVQ